MKYQILTIGGEAYLIDSTDISKIQETLENSKFINVSGKLIATHQVKAVLPLEKEKPQRHITFSHQKNEYHTITPSDTTRPKLIGQRMGQAQSRGENGISKSGNQWRSIQSALSKTIKSIP